MAKNKMKPCSVCGQDIASSAKACPHCGAKNKQPFFKKWWFWLLMVFIMIGASGNSSPSEGSNTTSTAADIHTNSSHSNNPDVTLPSSMPNVPSSPTSKESTSSIEPLDLDSAIAIFEEQTKNIFGENYSLSYDETGVTLNLWQDGLAAGATLAAAGDSDYIKLWQAMTDSLVSMNTSMVDCLAAIGYDNMIISLNLLNDSNHDNVLLMIINGAILYDCTKV